MQAMLDEAGLARTLQEIGIEAELKGPGMFHAVRSTDEGAIGFTLALEQDWLLLSVAPFLATQGENSFELARWLLRQNRDMYQAKFAYDAQGDVVLALEVPTEALGAEEIRIAIEALVRYAVEHRATLRAASRS